MTPGRDLRAEQLLLGCCLLSEACAEDALDACRPEDFSDSRHRHLWAVLLAMRAAGMPLALDTLDARLRASGELEQAGGAEYVVSLGDMIPTTQAAEEHARRVSDLAALRACVAAGGRIVAEGSEYVEDIPSYLSRSEQAIGQAVDQRTSTRKPITMGAAAARAVEQLVARQSGNLADGAPVTTGLRHLDYMLGGGAWPGHLTIVAGRPGMGKTALGMQIGRAASAVGPVMVFSLEMPADELGRRELSMEAQVDSNRIRASRLNDDEMRRVLAAAEKLERSRLLIDDMPGATVLDIRRAATRQKRKGGLVMVVVDYLQLMRAVDRGASREETVSEISRTLKEMAKQLGVPFIALSQLNRTCESRGDRRPILSDLRESGSIEQDADEVVFLYRDEVYNAESKQAGTAEIIIGKQRGGPTGTIIARYVREHTTFYDIEKQHNEDQSWHDQRAY